MVAKKRYNVNSNKWFQRRDKVNKILKNHLLIDSKNENLVYRILADYIY
jgi:hypothetical protein